MKYLFNPATDNFESLEPTLKDRFNLKDQMADAASATEMAIDESLKAFKTYQDAGGTMSYKDFIASGNEGVSKFFKDGGRVPQLVQPGPGRQGYKGTPVISSILEELKGTKSTPVDLEAILKKYEITARSSKKNIKDRLIKEGYKIKKYPVSRQVENVIKKLATYESSVDREKLQNLYESIVDANNTDTGLLIKHDKKIADKSASVLMKEAGFGKTMRPGANRFAQELIDRHLVSTKNKMRTALKNMLSNENAAFDGLTKPIERIAKRFGVKDNVVRTALQDFPFYKQNKAMITRLGHADFIKKWKGQDLLLGEVAELAELKPLRPYFNRGPEGLIQQMAYRHFKAGGDKINFLNHPDQYDPKDWKFEYKGKTYDYLDLARTRDDPNFKSVWKAIDDVKNYEEFKITDPKILEEFGYKKPTKLGTIMRRAYGVGTGKKGYFYSRVKDIDHFGNILEEPFENLRALDARTNRAAGHIDLHLSGDEAIKAKKKIGYFNQIDYNDVDAFNQMVDRDLQLARDILIPSKRYPTGRKLRTGYNIGKEYAQSTPTDTKPKKKIQGANLAKKSLKSFAKAFPVIGTAIGLYDVNKALKAGITDPRDLYIAYEVSADVAAKNKAIREDPTGELGRQEIANLPDIGQELPDSDEVAGLKETFPGSNMDYLQAVQDGFQGSFEDFLQLQSIPQSERPLTGKLDLPEMDKTMMAAQGGRVGFQDGTPDPIFDQITAALNNTDLIENLEQENKRTLEEQVLGEEGDRTLMQTLNTMIDPRAYPYYAQELASGVANIPELAFRFPAALAYLFGKTSLATTTGDLSQIGMKDVQKAMEIMDPKLTKAVKEKIGFKDMLEESREKATGPQRTTGGLLEFGAEAVGPATPFFLLKAFPKIGKQIRNLVGTAASAEKVNKEIETKMATQGVDQTRRDILLAAGAGGAVAVLKYLGLDKLIKTTKVAKAAPEIITKGGTPKYFFDFVNLIKTKGDDVTDKAATIERQKVYDYDGYTMYEDISSGKISIRKDTSGGANYYVGDGEYETIDGILYKEEIVYDPPETIVGKDGKAKEVPDIYEETTLKPDYDGSDGDVEGGLESINEILELLAKDGNKYSLKELKEMGMNPEGLGRDFLEKILKNPDEIKLLDSEKAFKDTINKVKYKIEKAEGGIIAGVSSGPPPKSGPTPHGLPYVAKNVRPITERK